MRRTLAYARRAVYGSNPSMSKTGVVVACLLLTFVGATSVFAQQAATATLSGRVTDPNGAVIAGAKVTAAQKATGAKRETVTNSEGVYALTNLIPGDYEVRIDARNFPQALVRRIELNVGQQAIFDGTLQASGPTEIITLDDRFNYPLVNTGSAIINGVVHDYEVERLPLNGRNYLELALLVPGATPAPNLDPTKTGSVLISSAGQLGRGGNITIDGTDNNDDAVGGPLVNISQDAVQEFQIATNRFSADLDRSASSVRARSRSRRSSVFKRGTVPRA